MILEEGEVHAKNNAASSRRGQCRSFLSWENEKLFGVYPHLGVLFVCEKQRGRRHFCLAGEEAEKENVNER